MGDVHYGFIRRDGFDCFVDNVFAILIEGSCYFIEDINIYITQKHSGKNNTLFLTARKFNSSFTYDGIKTIG